jgi:hypothetical protein
MVVKDHISSKIGPAYYSIGQTSKIGFQSVNERLRKIKLDQEPINIGHSANLVDSHGG